MDTNKSPTTSPTFRIVTTMITLAGVGTSFGMTISDLGIGKAALAVLIVYIWITGMIAITAKFPSSAGVAVETPIGARVNWWLIFMIGGIMTFILVGAGGAAQWIFWP